MLGGSGELFKGSKTNKLSFFIIKLEPLLDLVDCLWPLSGGEIMLSDIIYNVFDQRRNLLGRSIVEGYENVLFHKRFALV